MLEGQNPAILFMMLAVSVAAYFLPTIIACCRNHTNTVSIMLINIFFGWTLIGWIAALIWSIQSVLQVDVQSSGASPASPPSDKIASLEKLASLKERGFISDKEFEEEKRKLLDKN